MSSDKRENPEQIPSSHDEEQTKSMVSEQARIEGERKEVDVKDYPKAAAIAQVLKDLEFPADKKQIVDYVERARPRVKRYSQIYKNRRQAVSKCFRCYKGSRTCQSVTMLAHV